MLEEFSVRDIPVARWSCQENLCRGGSFGGLEGREELEGSGVGPWGVGGSVKLGHTGGGTGASLRVQGREARLGGHLKDVTWLGTGGSEGL